MDPTLAFLAAIVESSDDAIIGFNSYGRIASWNKGAEEIYGYMAREVIGLPINILALPERRDEFHHLQSRLLLGEKIKHFQTIHLTRDGKMLHISLSISPIITTDGRLLGASTIARDITERLRAEEALRQTEEKYRLIFAAESDAIILFDADTGAIVDFNHAALKLYGYSGEEFARLTRNDLNASPAPLEGSADRRPGDKTIRTLHALHRRKDATTFTAEMSTSTFSWGQRLMLVGIVRDITQRQRSRKLLRSLAVAREIQQHLLPQRAPRIPGLDIHASSTSCEEIGGDYYDFFPNPGGQQQQTGFVVGDVSGHGIGAALLMAMSKGMLHSEFGTRYNGLEDVFTGMNHLLVPSSEDGTFMTLCCGIIDTANRTLHWISAGHGPAFLYQNRQDIMRELPTTSIPLGIKTDEHFIPAEPIALAPGDILLIGTDGIWEARNPQGTMFEPHRIRQLIATLASRTARQIHDAIMAKLGTFMNGHPPEDDMTLLVIKIIP